MWPCDERPEEGLENDDFNVVHQLGPGSVGKALADDAVPLEGSQPCFFRASKYRGSRSRPDSGNNLMLLKVF